MKISELPVRVIILGAFSLCLLSGCGDREKKDSQLTGKPEKVVPVAVEEVAVGNLIETFTLPASLEAWEDLTLAAEIAGPVKKIHFKEGDQVRKDDVLLEIDPETIKNYLRRDRENVAVIGRKLERYRQLEMEGLVSRQDVEDLENSLIAADAALQTSILQLEKSFPRAPVDGIVDHLFVDRGEYVDPGTTLMRLVQIDKLKVIADVPEKDIHFLKIGQSVEITPAAINLNDPLVLTGTIEYIAYAANDMTRTYRTKMIIENNAGDLRPGMIVRARFVRQELDQVVSVPLFAVMDREGEKLVFVAENGLARKITVLIGSSVGQRVVVRQGLTAGQKLIIKGQQLLVDGVRIDVGDQ